MKNNLKAAAAGTLLSIVPMEAEGQNVIYTSYTRQYEPQYRTHVAKPPEGYMNEVWGSANIQNGTDMNLDFRYSQYIGSLPLRFDVQLTGKARTWELPKEGLYAGAKIGGEKEENMLNLAGKKDSRLTAYLWAGPEFYRSHYLGAGLYSTVELDDWFLDMVLKHEKNLYFDGLDEKPAISGKKDNTFYFSLGRSLKPDLDVGISATVSKPRAIYRGRLMDDSYRWGDVYGYVSKLTADGGRFTFRAGKRTDMKGYQSYTAMLEFSAPLHMKGEKPLRAIAKVFRPNPRMDNLDKISPRRRARRERIRDRYYERMHKRRETAPYAPRGGLNR